MTVLKETHSKGNSLKAGSSYLLALIKEGEGGRKEKKSLMMKKGVGDKCNSTLNWKKRTVRNHSKLGISRNYQMQTDQAVTMLQCPVSFRFRGETEP